MIDGLSEARVIGALTATAACVSLAAITYFRNRKAPVNRYFAFFNLSLAVWNAGELFVLFTRTHPALALGLDRVSCFGAMAMIPWYLKLVNEVTGGRGIRPDRNRTIHRMFLVACVVLSVLLPTALIIKTVQPPPDEEIPGQLFAAFGIYLLFGLGVGIVQFFLAYRRSTPIEKNRLKYFIVAFFIGSMGAADYFVTCMAPSATPLYHYFEILYDLIFAYAILNRQVMDLGLAFRDTTVYLATGFLLACASVIVGLPLVSLNPYLGLLAGTGSMGLLMVFAYDPIRKAIQPAIDRLMFANRFAYLEELAQLPNDMLEFTNLREMLKFLVTRLTEAAKLDRVRVLMYDPGHQSYVETIVHLADSEEGKSGQTPTTHELSETSQLSELLRKNQRLLLREDLSHAAPEKASALQELESLGGVACFPVMKARDLLGMVILGPKSTGEPFNQQDLKILGALRTRLENFLGQAMVITQEALNMVKDSHDMKNDVNALKGRVTWRAMRIAGWKMDFDKQAQVFEGAADRETMLAAFAALRKQALEWFSEADRSRLVEDQAIQRLAHRLKNWAEYGRVISEGFRGSRAMEAIEIGEAARLSVERWKPHAEKKSLQLVLESSPDLVVWGERTLVEQVIENLIDNAIKATQQGKVTVHCASDRDGILLQVRDTGCGIAAEDLSTIFAKPFYQGKGRETLEQSTGVGLYLVSQYVRSLNGRVWAESQAGHGSTFFVHLPRHDHQGQRQTTGAAA